MLTQENYYNIAFLALVHNRNWKLELWECAKYYGIL
jgi:hypothetical protein